MIESLANVFLGINLVISLYTTLLVFRKQTTRLFKVMGLLLFLFVLYGLISFLSNDPLIVNGEEINKGTYIIGPLRTFLPIYTFFLFAKLGMLTEKSIRIWFFPFLAISIYCFFSASMVLYGQKEDDLITNNTGYLFAGLFPFVYFFRRKKIIQYAIIAILILFSLFAMKRGAFLVVAVCLLYYLYGQTRNVKMSTKFTTIVLILITLAGVWIFSNEKLKSSDRFQNRVEQTIEGNDSNRGNLHKIQLDNFVNRGDIVTFLFGFGADGTLKISPNYAHNDWIEVLVDQGILGLSIFLYFWIVFFKTWRRSKKIPWAYNIIGMIFISSLIRTVFSMWYSNTNMFVAIPLGYCLALLYRGYNLQSNNIIENQIEKNE